MDMDSLALADRYVEIFFNKSEIPQCERFHRSLKITTSLPLGNSHN